jgi:hypothetical protein
LGFLAGVVVLLWVTLRYKVWFRDDAADAENTIDLLSDMKELHQEGGLTDEEFRSIKTRLVQAAVGVSASRSKAGTASKLAMAKAAEAATSPTRVDSPQETPEAEAGSDDAGEQGPGRATS